MWTWGRSPSRPEVEGKRAAPHAPPATTTGDGRSSVSDFIAQANTSKSNLLLSNCAWSTRGVLFGIGSFLAAASSATLASSAPAWARATLASSAPAWGNETARGDAGPKLAWEKHQGLKVVVDPHAQFGAGGGGASWQTELTEALAHWAEVLQDKWFQTFLTYQITRLGDDLLSAEDGESLVVALRTRLEDPVVGEMKHRLIGGFVDEARAVPPRL